MVLSEELAQQVEHLRSDAVLANASGDSTRAINSLNKAWELLPELKTEWRESFTIVSYLTSIYLKIGNLDMAYKMAIRLMSCSPQRQDIGEREYTLGIVQLERGQKEEAFESFVMANKKSKGNIWRLSSSQPYRDFFKNHASH